MRRRSAIQRIEHIVLPQEGIARWTPFGETRRRDRPELQRDEHLDRRERGGTLPPVTVGRANERQLEQPDQRATDDERPVSPRVHGSKRERAPGDRRDRRRDERAASTCATGGAACLA